MPKIITKTDREYMIRFNFYGFPYSVSLYVKSRPGIGAFWRVTHRRDSFVLLAIDQAREQLRASLPDFPRMAEDKRLWTAKASSLNPLSRWDGSDGVVI